MAKFYHGTSREKWQAIQRDGILWGIGLSYRHTYLTPEIEIARHYGEIVLEVEYEPKGSGVDNYGFNPPPGETCWQFAVFEPIPISKICMKGDTKDA